MTFCSFSIFRPIYYNNNEPQKGIFKDNGKWYCMENDDFSDMNNDICPLKENLQCIGTALPELQYLQKYSRQKEGHRRERID